MKTGTTAAAHHAPSKGEDTKRRIIDAAEEVVLRDGVARLTLDAAAAEAGLSKGGVLYHFPTRDALVAGMVGKIIEEFDRDIEANMERRRRSGPIPPGLHPGHHGSELDPARTARTGWARHSSPRRPPNRRCSSRSRGRRPLAGAARGRRAGPDPGHGGAPGL